MFNLLSSMGMEESRNVSDEQMMSISLKFMWSSKRDNLINSWASRPFKFQWQNLRAELLRVPGLDSISPDFNKIKFLMYKQCKTNDISKKLHVTFLTGH